MGLGTYPDVGIAAARREGLRMREIIASGEDPIRLRDKERREREELAQIPTFEEAAREAYASRVEGFGNTKHAAQWITTLETYIFPKIGRVKVDDLRAEDFGDALRPIWLTKAEIASRVKQRCDAVMKWAAARGFIVASPVPVVTELLRKQPATRERVQHQPAVPWREVRKVIEEVLHTEPAAHSKRALEFLILTATRSGEVREMTWDELDLGDAVWILPPERTKTNLRHRVPLSSRAIELLEQQRELRDGSLYVFPSRSGGPLSDMTLTKLLRSAKVASDTPRRIATVHGFRSSFREWLQSRSCRACSRTHNPQLS